MSEHKHIEDSRNLFITILLNGLITLAEVAGGLVSNSLSLLSDALHNLTDTIALLMAWFAKLAARKSSSARKTFGFKRAEILAALFSSALLLVVCIYLFVEAIQRLKQPEEVRSQVMLIVAFIGLAGNLGGVLLLHRDSDHNLNIRSAYLHLLGDALSSIAVILGGILIYFFHIYWIDGLLTMLISLFILKETYGITREAVDILMQAVPRNLDLDEVCATLEQVPGIVNVHHVHAWRLTDNDIHFECHVDLREDLRVSETKTLRDSLENLLQEQFGINHITLQFEVDCCGDERYINH